MILITRPLDDSILLKKELDEFKVESFIEPLLAPVFYRVNADSDLLVTSKNAIRALLHKAENKEELKINAMTEGIANFARLSGFKYVNNFNCNNVSEFEEKISNLLPKEREFTYLSGLHITEDIVTNLTKVGFTIRQEIAYEMMQIENFTDECLILINSAKINSVTLFSRRSARIFKSLCEIHKINPYDFKYFVLSENIALELQSCDVSIAEYPNQESLIKNVRGLIQCDNG